MNQMLTFNAEYWNQRYKDHETGWDLGHMSRPIKTYVDQLDNKALTILIPGAGNSFEAEYLWNLGFKNVYIIDIASIPLINFKNRVPDFPEDHLLVGNFFDLDLTVDLLLEQTFFCAIDPVLRPQYVQQAARILRPGGRLAGVLFAHPFPFQGPPFGGTQEKYRSLFSASFRILQLEISPYSIAPRLGNEYFIELEVI